MDEKESSPGLSDFPLFEGGPHYRALNTVGLRAPDRKNALPLALLTMLITWVPLALLTAAQGLFACGTSGHPFASDVALHLKLLLATPAFILSDRIVCGPLHVVLRRFLDHRIVADADRERFTSHVASALRLRDARFSSILILGVAYCCAILLIQGVLAGVGSNWHFLESDGAHHLSWAGWWHGLVSYPFYVFILLRFFYRLALWWRLMFQIARMPLRLQPAHPDRSGGLTFVGEVLNAFMLPAFALSAALSSSTAALMMASGASIAAHKNGIIAIATFVFVLFALPLLFFIAPLARARRESLVRYDALASAQQSAYEKNWAADPLSAFLGDHASSPGPSEVADLNAVVASIRTMRVIPAERADFIGLLIAILLPFVAMLSTEIPLAEMLQNLLGLFI